MNTTNTEEIIRQFKKAVCDEVSIEPQGLESFAIYTPFCFDDGDHFLVHLESRGNEWVLTDCGHTFMHMSYTDLNFNDGTRREIIDDALQFHAVNDTEGVLTLPVPEGRFGEALYSYIQALCKITSVTKFTRKVAKSTFYGDIAGLVEAVIPAAALQRDWHDQESDPDGWYKADFRIRGKNRDWLLFGVHSDVKCSDVTITCLNREKFEPTLGSIVIFENQTAISRKKLAQLSDAVGKQFSSMHDKSRIRHYFEAEVLGNASYS